MDENMKLWFCNIVTECFKDHYISPSIEWTKLPVKDLRKEYQLFEAKKKQAEKMLKEDPNDFHDIHFAYLPDPNRHEKKLSFDTESCFLEELGDFPGRKIIQNGKDLRKGMLALRWVLGGHGLHIPKIIQQQFQSIGIIIESLPLSGWDLKHIALQALAQYWVYKSGDVNSTRIKERILDSDKHIQSLFRIGEWNCINRTSDNIGLPKDRARTIERLISDVCRSRNINIVNDAKAVKINFGKMKAILYYLSIALAMDGVSLEAILRHPLVRSYLSRVPWFPSLYSMATGWVKQAVRSVNFFNSKSQRV